MGKGRLLDLADQKADMKRTWWIGVLAASSLIGCGTIRRSALMKDVLTAQEHQMLGDAYLAKGDKILAAQQYQASLKRDKSFAPALLALGNLSYEDKDW